MARPTWVKNEFDWSLEINRWRCASVWEEWKPSSHGHQRSISGFHFMETGDPAWEEPTFIGGPLPTLEEAKEAAEAALFSDLEKLAWGVDS